MLRYDPVCTAVSTSAEKINPLVVATHSVKLQINLYK
jgi:hypothetical protein